MGQLQYDTNHHTPTRAHPCFQEVVRRAKTDTQATDTHTHSPSLGIAELW